MRHVRQLNRSCGVPVRRGVLCCAVHAVPGLHDCSNIRKFLLLIPNLPSSARTATTLLAPMLLYSALHDLQPCLACTSTP